MDNITGRASGQMPTDEQMEAARKALADQEWLHSRSRPVDRATNVPVRIIEQMGYGMLESGGLAFMARMGTEIYTGDTSDEATFKAVRVALEETNGYCTLKIL